MLVILACHFLIRCLLFVTPFPFAPFSYVFFCEMLPPFLIVLPWYIFVIWLGTSFSLCMFRTKCRSITYYVVAFGLLTAMFVLSIVSTVIISSSPALEEITIWEKLLDIIYCVIFFFVGISLLFQGISLCQITLNPGLLSIFKWKLKLLTATTFLLAFFFMLRFVWNMLNEFDENVIYNYFWKSISRCLEDDCSPFFWTLFIYFSFFEVLPSLTFLITFAIFSFKSVVPSASSTLSSDDFASGSDSTSDFSSSECPNSPAGSPVRSSRSSAASSTMATAIAYKTLAGSAFHNIAKYDPLVNADESESSEGEGDRDRFSGKGRGRGRGRDGYRDRSSSSERGEGGSRGGDDYSDASSFSHRTSQRSYSPSLSSQTHSTAHTHSSQKSYASSYSSSYSSHSTRSTHSSHSHSTRTHRRPYAEGSSRTHRNQDASLSNVSGVSAVSAGSVGPAGSEEQKSKHRRSRQPHRFAVKGAPHPVEHSRSIQRVKEKEGGFSEQSVRSASTASSDAPGGAFSAALSGTSNSSGHFSHRSLHSPAPNEQSSIRSEEKLSLLGRQASEEGAGFGVSQGESVMLDPVRPPAAVSASLLQRETDEKDEPNIQRGFIDPPVEYDGRDESVNSELQRKKRKKKKKKRAAQVASPESV